MNALHRRLQRLEHPKVSRGKHELAALISAYVDLWDDPAALREELKHSPARPGSEEAAIDAELWEMLEGGTCIA